MGLISDAFEKHKLVRRLIVVWAAALITHVVLEVTSKITAVDGHAVTFAGLVIGLLGTAIAFYKWSRDKEDQNVD